jgi:Raf kinase inhibitor-like YbhB/YbcL family protein
MKCPVAMEGLRMLEHVPHWLGQALRGLRAGADKLCIAQLEGDYASIEVSSPAFADGGRLPPRFTADGEGVSPPLIWGPLPMGTVSLALIVEDPDSLSLDPLVHAVVWGISPEDHRLEEGAIRADEDCGDGGSDVGRNSFFFEGWLPPDPPTGHGDHHYVFQLFALADTMEPGRNPGRAALVKAMAGKVLASGFLTGLYSRGEPKAVSGKRTSPAMPNLT